MLAHAAAHDSTTLSADQLSTLGTVRLDYTTHDCSPSLAQDASRTHGHTLQWANRP